MSSNTVRLAIAASGMTYHEVARAVTESTNGLLKPSEQEISRICTNRAKLSMQMQEAIRRVVSSKAHVALAQAHSWCVRRSMMVGEWLEQSQEASR